MEARQKPVLIQVTSAEQHAAMYTAMAGSAQPELIAVLSTIRRAALLGALTQDKQQGMLKHIDASELAALYSLVAADGATDAGKALLQAMPDAAERALMFASLGDAEQAGMVLSLD